MLYRTLIGATAFVSLTAVAVAQTSTQPTAPAPAAPATASPTTATPAPGAPASQSAATSEEKSNWGIRTVDPTTLRLTFYTVRPADMLASNLLELDVYNLQNEEVGEIEDVIIDNGKAIKAVVISVGGFLGLGERHVAIEPGAIAITRSDAGELRAVVNSTRDDLKNAPEFRFEGAMTRN